MPRDHRVEARVEIDIRPHGMMRDPVAQRPQPLDRLLALRRREVVEDRARHQEPRRPRPLLRLDLGDRERTVQRQVDVVAQDQVAGHGAASNPAQR